MPPATMRFHGFASDIAHAVHSLNIIGLRFDEFRI